MLPAHSAHPLPRSWKQTLIQGSLAHFSEGFLEWTLTLHMVGSGVLIEVGPFSGQGSPLCFFQGKYIVSSLIFPIHI